MSAPLPILRDGAFIYVLDPSLDVNRLTAQVTAGYTPAGRTSTEEVMAFAVKLAAVDDLLRALRELLTLPRAADEQPWVKLAFMNAEAAVAKAEGRAA
jgi:hypothetical protein